MGKTYKDQNRFDRGEERNTRKNKREKRANNHNHVLKEWEHDEETPLGDVEGWQDLKDFDKEVGDG